MFYTAERIGFFSFQPSEHGVRGKVTLQLTHSARQSVLVSNQLLLFGDRHQILVCLSTAVLSPSCSPLWRVGGSVTSHGSQSLPFFTHGGIYNYVNNNKPVTDIYIYNNVHICTLYIYIYIYTGRFIIFYVITNIYNKKTKGPTLMEFFTATGKLKTFFFFDN